MIRSGIELRSLESRDFIKKYSARVGLGLACSFIDARSSCPPACGSTSPWLSAWAIPSQSAMSSRPWSSLSLGPVS